MNLCCGANVTFRDDGISVSIFFFLQSETNSTAKRILDLSDNFGLFDSGEGIFYFEWPWRRLRKRIVRY